MDWEIRQATANDIPALVQFNCAIAQETEGKQLHLETVTQGVTRGLQQAGDVTYFVIDSADGPIGALLLTREWSDWRDGWLMWIQSVYVVPDRRGQGVFRALLKHVVENLRQQPDVVGLRLYVEAENHRAQVVYQRTGFVDSNYKVLEQLF